MSDQPAKTVDDKLDAIIGILQGWPSPIVVVGSPPQPNALQRIERQCTMMAAKIDEHEARLRALENG